MPTLKSGNGELENGSSEIIKSPGFLSYAMNKASAVLGIIGATVATDVAAQQAPNNFAPNVAALTEPAVPGNTENASQIPTAQTIIDTLRNGKETIKRKFSTYNDAVFQQIVGQIGLGTVKSETLIALAGAFPKGSVEQENILSFSKTISTPKQPAPLTSTQNSREKKLPPINETKAEKEARREKERQENILKETLSALNKGGFFKKEAWSSNDGKGAKANTKHTKESITVEFDPKTVKKGVVVSAAKSTASMKVTLLPGRAYKWTFGQISDKAIIQLKENQNGKFTSLVSGMTTGANLFRIPDGHDGTVELEVVNTAMVPITKIEKATLEEITDEEAKVAGL